EFKPADLGHPHIGDNAAGFDVGQDIEERLGGREAANAKIGGREQEGERFPRRIVIVYDMDHQLAGHPSSSSGVTPRRVKRKIDPPSGLGSIVICPPSDSMIMRAIDTPIPMPWRLVLTKGVDGGGASCGSRPGPVSATLTTTMLSAEARVDTTSSRRSAVSIASMAFRSKFSRTCST